MVEAGGVGTFGRVEKTQVIEKSGSTKRSKIRNCVQLERIWNARKIWVLKGQGFGDARKQRRIHKERVIDKCSCGPVN
jgi:hypothetical protein